MNDYDYIYLMKEQLNKHEDIELTIYGKSMLPTIADGQKIKIRLAENLKIGDIISTGYIPPVPDIFKRIVCLNKRRQ